jgi:SAM-dependent methyltransferase
LTDRTDWQALGDHAGAAYLRYSFTRGTEQEVAFLVETLDLRPGQRVLDVACGPGRHAHALAGRGMEVVGVDVSRRFVEVAAEAAPPGAAFVRADAHRLPFGAVFDAAVFLFQGDADAEMLAAVAGALRPGGRLAMTAFSAYFLVRHLEERDDFDVDAGVNHERTVVRDEEGREAEFGLWTACFTPRELRLLAERCGLVVRRLWSVAPGRYAPRPPDLELPELLMVAERD